MALLTLSQYKVFAGITNVDATRDGALQMMIDEVCDAIIRYLKNGSIEQASYTVILPAPVSLALVLPFVPVVVSTVQIWLNLNANGDPANFTSDNLLTAYTDYMVDTSLTDTTSSGTGIVRNLTSSWGVTWARPPLALAAMMLPVPGAVKVTYTAGYATVPPSIQMAACLIASKLYNMRRTGIPLTNESLQSYSYGSQASATADGIIQGDPTVRGLLAPFGRHVFVGSYQSV